MGLYTKLQIAIGKAFDTSLADATRILQFIEITDVYDSVSMTSAQTETSYNIRAVVEKDLKSEEQDSSSGEDTFNILVLDSDRNGLVFDKDMLVKDESDYYQIISIDSDPAKASWSIKARKKG